MNLILFKEDESTDFLPINDYRTKHILNIIKSSVGDQLDMGILNGPKGKLTITEINGDGLFFQTELTGKSDDPYPVTFIIGTPRPPVAKRLLKDLSTSGVKKIIMCATDLGEKTYLTSKLWRDDNYLKYLYEGASQAESTLIPEIARFYSLKKALESIEGDCDRLAMDNINPDYNISSYKPEHKEVVICIGGERGFSDREREMLRDFNYKIFKLGSRVLRTETACHNVLGSILSSRDLI